MTKLAAEQQNFLQQGPRQLLMALLLAVSLIAPVIGGVSVEVGEYRQIEAALLAEARQDTAAYASQIANRLNTQFTELEFATVTLLGPDADSTHPDPAVAESLRRYLATHPALYAFNILSAAGDRIEWSTADWTREPVAPLRLFTPVPGHPNLLLGPIRYMQAAGEAIMPMRVQVSDARGRVRYLLGSPYRISHLLEAGELARGHRPWPLTVIDSRDDVPVSGWIDDFGQTVAEPGVGADDDRQITIPAGDYPFLVRTRVPADWVWQGYRAGAPARWGLEALVLGLLTLAAISILRLLNRDQVRRLERLTDFNAFLAQVSQFISHAEDEAKLLQDICDLAIRYAHLKVAFIARPDPATGYFQFLAVSGVTAYVAGMRISAFPDVPEGQGSVGQVWRTGRSIFNASFEKTPYMHPWHDRALRLGLRSAAALPIHRDGQIWAVLSVYHDQPDIFDHDLQELLEEIAMDISRGLETLYSRRLQNALLDNSVVGILLVKDRVIRPANARAAEMLGFPAGGLTEKSTEVLYADKQEFERVGAAYDELRRSGEVRVPGVRLLRPDGRLRIADFSGVQLRDLTGDFSVWTIDDVTSRETAQRLYHALINAADTVLQAAGEAEMFERICTELVRDTLFHAVWIARPDAGHLRTLAHAGDGDSGVAALDLTLADTANGLVTPRAWNEQAVVYNNDGQSDAILADWHPFLHRHGWRAMLAAPVWRGRAMWAVITFVSPLAQVFDEQSIALCRRVADLLGHALDMLDAKQHIEKLQLEEAQRARHDALTGLPNRLALEEYLPQALARASRRGTALAVGMLDLDDFKPVNDTYGHEAGDLLLQELARRLRDHLRQTDYIVRLGGDEFVMVLEELDALLPVDQITVVLNRLHQSVEVPFQVGGGDAGVCVGMTVGLALYPVDGCDPDTLVRQADAAMYQAKQIKSSRTTWWRLADSTGGHAPAEVAGAPFDVYGKDAQLLLTKARSFFQHLRQRFVDRFYDEVKGLEQGHILLDSLTEAEFASLKERQAAHLDFLVDPQTTREDILTAAHRLGVVHALCGVAPSLLTEAYGIYRRLLMDSLDKALLNAYDRYHILLITEMRLQDDKATQFEAGQGTQQSYLSVLSDRLPMAGSIWADASAQAVNELSRLPGVLVTVLLRMNPDGVMVVETSAGQKAREFVDALRRTGAHAVINAESPYGQTMSALAWRSRRSQSCPSYAHDPRVISWRDIAMPLGLRSSMSVPVKEGDDHVAAVVTLFGAFPNQFESQSMHEFARGLQQRWEQIWTRCTSQNPAAVTEDRARELRDSLLSDGLRMFLQPIVDLQTGDLLEVEALARLKEADGEMVSPAVFLPLLGRNELDRLFHLGLDQGLAWLPRWDAAGVPVNLAINLPPTYLLNAEGARWVADSLRRHGVAPHRLTVELLETQSIDPGTQDCAIGQFKDLGVRVAMDDLGSGYSSLLRLSTLPFDIIKVDQGLLRHIRDNPLQALSIVKTVLDMGADFRRQVIVEGLEDADVIEAVGHLGARYGQGYAIAHPMPAEDFLDWHQAHCRAPAVRFRRNHIGSDLGALAYHWVATRGGQDRSALPVADCPVTQYLEAQGLSDSEAAHWHQRCHIGPDAQEGTLLFTNWLVERVVAAARSTASET